MTTNFNKQQLGSLAAEKPENKNTRFTFTVERWLDSGYNWITLLAFVIYMWLANGKKLKTHRHHNEKWLPRRRPWHETCKSKAGVAPKSTSMTECS